VRLHYRPADRSQPYCDDAFHQARRQDLAAPLPGQADYQEAGRSSYGLGQGALDHWVAVVRPGKILFEMEGVTPTVAEEAMRLASNKLPLRTKFVMRPGAEKAVAEAK